MTTSEPGVDPRATDVAVTEDELSVVLADRRRVIAPRGPVSTPAPRFG